MPETRVVYHPPYAHRYAHGGDDGLTHDGWGPWGWALCVGMFLFFLALIVILVGAGANNCRHDRSCGSHGLCTPAGVCACETSWGGPHCTWDLRHDHDDDDDHQEHEHYERDNKKYGVGHGRRHRTGFGDDEVWAWIVGITVIILFAAGIAWCMLISDPDFETHQHIIHAPAATPGPPRVAHFTSGPIYAPWRVYSKVQ